MNDIQLLQKITEKLEITVDMEAEKQIENSEQMTQNELDTSQKLSDYCSELLYFIWHHKVNQKKLNKLKA